MKSEIYFVIGGPGSGKGTQCVRYTQKHPDYVHIPVGDIVRHKIGSDPAFQALVSQGKLLDDQFVLNLIKEEMEKHPDAAGFLIDGYPRTKSQVTLFDEQVSTDYKTLHFDVPSHVMEERLLQRNEGRTDDTPETIKRRIQVYKDNTLPAIAYLQQKDTDASKVIYINAALNKDYTAHQIEIAIANNGMVSVGLVEFVQLYFSCGNVYDAIHELEKRYLANDFQIGLFYMTALYIIQSRKDAKTVLSANTIMGNQYGHFDSAHGHRSIAGMQTFTGGPDNERDHIWNNLHKAISTSVTNDKAEIERLVSKNMHRILRDGTFELDIAFEDFMVSLWCEYLFGENVNPEEFKKTRDKMLRALHYSFYDSRLKVIPYVGDLACKLYRYLNQNTFTEIDNEFKKYIAQSSSGLLIRIREALTASCDLPADAIEKLLLDNMIALILEVDFVHGAMYSTLVEITKCKIDKSDDRLEVYHQGLRASYLFPFRDRVARNDIQLTNATIASGSHVLVNLSKTGLYHSSGPRSCVGIGVTNWIKHAVFAQLKDIVLRVEKTSYPEERMALAHSKDVPISPERLTVRWKYTRDYLQRVLPNHPFKGVEHFYDVLKIFENPRLTHYLEERFIRKIKKIKGLDLSKLCIATAEVRGIPIASMIAKTLGVPLVIIRKTGKIPGEVLKENYQSAYANDEFEISASSDVKGKQIVFMDDGLASGGSALACCRLLERLGGDVKSVLTIINHTYAEKQRDAEKLSRYKVRSLFDFQKSVAEDIRHEVGGLKNS